jgi:hypothetical protein
MSRNRYVPPVARVDDPTAIPAAVGLGLLYSPIQIAVASFIGSPVAAAWLASANYRVLGQTSRARKTIVWGFVTTLALLALAATLPMRKPEAITLVGATLAIRGLADWQFSGAIEHHEEAGGGLGSWWRVVAIGMLTGLLIYGAVAAAFFLLTLLGVQSE